MYNILHTTVYSITHDAIDKTPTFALERQEIKVKSVNPEINGKWQQLIISLKE